MNSFIIMIILISVIITTSKVIMRFLRQQDIKNGLKLAVYFSASKVMKTDVITMISGRSTGKNGRRLRMKKSHLSVKIR